MPKKVFISYASKDRQTAMTICHALEGRGQTCWISCRDIHPGENYQESIVRAIRGAGVMLLVLSANANNSDEIKKEIALASQSHLMVIPVRAEDVVPSEAFSYELATRQWVDLFENWDQAMGELVVQLDSVNPQSGESGAGAPTLIASRAPSRRPCRSLRGRSPQRPSPAPRFLPPRLLLQLSRRPARSIGSSSGRAGRGRDWRSRTFVPGLFRR